MVTFPALQQVFSRAAAVLLLPLMAVMSLSLRPAGAAEPAIRVMPLEEVRPGMRGVVRTVFEGSGVEEFEAEILGVMANFLGPHQDLILARLRGEKVEFTGVAAGMSGSPVYVDGRLVGAVAYRIMSEFMKEPIAGITPIEYMLEMEPRLTATSAHGSASGLPLEGAGVSPGAPIVPRIHSFAPIDTPVVVSGVSPEVLDVFDEDLRVTGLGPVQAGGSGPASPVGGPGKGLSPGEPVAMQLVRGDLGVAATGTVTHVESDRVWAFGHFGLTVGALDIPMARAHIHLTLPSLQASVKLSSILDTVGTFTQSRLPGIAGVLGPVPEMIPVAVTWDASGTTRIRNYELAAHREFTPILIGIVTLSTLARTPGFAGEMTMSLQGRIRLEGHPDVLINDLHVGFSQDQSAAVSVARQMQGLFGAVFANRFEAPKVEAVDVSVSSVEEGKVAFVEGVYPTSTVLRPGEETEFRVVIRPYRGESHVLTLRYRVPPGTPPGPLLAYVGAADELEKLERNMFARQVAQADNLDQIIALINRLRTSDAIYMKISQRRTGAVVQNEVLPALPPSVLTTMGSNRGAGEFTPIPDTTLAEERFPIEQILIGGTIVRLEVR